MLIKGVNKVYLDEYSMVNVDNLLFVWDFILPLLSIHVSSEGIYPDIDCRRHLWNGIKYFNPATPIAGFSFVRICRPSVPGDNAKRLGCKEERHIWVRRFYNTLKKEET